MTDIVERLREGMVRRPVNAVTDAGVMDPNATAALMSEAAQAIEELRRERDRCHARLEIDHYFKIGDNDDSDLERVDIPLGERADFPDAVTVRDATIKLLEEQVAAAVDDYNDSQAAVTRLREALRPFSVVGAIVDGPFGPALFVDDEMGFKSGCAWTENGETKTLTWGDFRRARTALQDAKGGTL